MTSDAPSPTTRPAPRTVGGHVVIPTAAQVEAIIRQVARLWGVHPARLRERGRGANLGHARSTAYYALYLAGLPVHEIARLFHRRHGTISPCIASVHRRPDHVARAELALACLTGGADAATLGFWLAQYFDGVGQRQAGAVRAYVLCSLFGLEHHPAEACLAGLALLRAEGALRARLALALRACNVEPHLARIAMHGRSLALPS